MNETRELDHFCSLNIQNKFKDNFNISLQIISKDFRGKVCGIKNFNNKG